MCHSLNNDVSIEHIEALDPKQCSKDIGVMNIKIITPRENKEVCCMWCTIIFKLVGATRYNFIFIYEHYFEVNGNWWCQLWKCTFTKCNQICLDKLKIQLKQMDESCSCSFRHLIIVLSSRFFKISLFIHSKPFDTICFLR